ncbi:MAG: 4-alpha-glucanotransferase [Chitinophagaceae bacterium]
MKVTFYLRFRTQFGQSLSIRQTQEQQGKDAITAETPMLYLNEEYWHLAVEVDASKVTRLRYQYVLNDMDDQQVNEARADRVLDLSQSTIPEWQTVDTWTGEGEFENVFFTSPFQQVLLPEEGKIITKPVHIFTHIFKVKAPLLKKNEVVCLAGSGQALGNWSKTGALMLSKEGKWWNVKVNMPAKDFPLKYKYGTYNTKEKEYGSLEVSNDRFLPEDASPAGLTVIHDGFAKFPDNTWKGAGVSIPVFSLKSKSSFGIGEFADLKLLADWAKEAGLKLIQILPVNDTTATHSAADSYPYAAISAVALHPVYVNLEKVAGKKYTSILKQLKKKQKQLNDLVELNYEQVLKFKLSALKELFVAQKENYQEDPAFLTFFQANKHWLVPYAAFCYLRDKNGTADYSQWKQYSHFDKAAIEKFVSPKAKYFEEIAVHYFMQFHLHLQLKEATEYAHKKGIIVKGDIPIGIYRYSCDAWMNPDLYNMNIQAGAPPDDFAVKGQNWGFPTYNWQKMQENGFAWWRNRFEQMSNYFDAFRIDHILGFFRIWSIPVDAVEGIMGYFVPSIPLHLNEFKDRGIWLEQDRYTKPYITDTVLQDIFRESAEQIMELYLDEKGDGFYALKPDFDTQKKVEAHFAGPGSDGQDPKIKIGLFDLISNVILFKVPGPEEEFHFRIDMGNTSSFKSLDHHVQHQLNELYVDYFYRRQDQFWKKEAMKKLPALKVSTNMLVCGEDLGMVPHGVPEVMNQLGILSLEIQRMPKDPNREFFHPNDAPYLSVVTPSTHDMSTIRGWWEEESIKTQRFFNNELGEWGEAPLTCEPWINKAVIVQHLYSPAMWSVFQLQDILGMSDTLRRENVNDERINIPADPKHYWRYRMHITLEQLLKENVFNEDLKTYIHGSGR